LVFFANFWYFFVASPPGKFSADALAYTAVAKRLFKKLILNALDVFGELSDYPINYCTNNCVNFPHTRVIAGRVITSA